MLKKTYLSTSVVLGLLWFGIFAAAGHGQQSPTPASAPRQPCGRSPIQCPAPVSNDTFVHINLEPDANSVCRFDPRTIQDLRTTVGGDVFWSFCSTCPTDMQVQLDVPGGGGPFDKFKVFVPMPSADNLVAVAVPCNDYGHATGFNATSSGEWKYFLRARPAGTLTFPDEIDPRLEIDDRHLAPEGGPPRWIERLVLIGIGVLAGLYIARRRRSPPPRA